MHGLKHLKFNTKRTGYNENNVFCKTWRSREKVGDH